MDTETLTTLQTAARQARLAYQKHGQSGSVHDDLEELRLKKASARAREAYEAALELYLRETKVIL